VGLKGCRQQHLSPEPFIKKNNNYDGIIKIVLFLTIGIPGITSQMEQMYAYKNNALWESGNGRDMRGTWWVGGEINAGVPQLN